MSATTVRPRAWTTALPSFLAIGVGLVVLALVFLPECRAAIKVWSESTAYGHCYLVAPIAGYLAWDRRGSVRGMLPQAAPGLALLGLPLPLLWFASERLGIMEFRQFAVLGFVELLFLVVLGWKLFRAMMAPLSYLVFLVPFGAFLTPVLQAFTAWFIDVGLTVVGIPHFVSDMLVEISAGNFFVAEACAGLRFLIASLAFGVFYALLNYRSPRRRAVFIVASVAVPIVANGLRALGIVVLGHILGSAEAAAADHVIYGWVFFSIVMLLLVVAGLPMREDPWPARTSGADGASGRPTPLPWAALAVLALAAIGPAAARGFNGASGPLAFVGLPVIVAPEGCTAGAPAVEADRSESTIACPGRRWTVSVQALSPRSTGSALAEARTRMIGAIDPEDLGTETLHGLPPGAGSWLALVSRKPSAVTGIAVWVRGAPARGGLSQRVHQAVDSVVGTERPPVLVAISSRGDGRLLETEARAAVIELGRIVAAQPGLDATVAGLAVAQSR